MIRSQMDYYPPEKDNDKSILFIHGMWSNKETWQFWAPIYAKAGYKCWTINLHPRKGDTSILDYVAMVKEGIRWIQYHFEETPILIGHSMGGLIAQLIAAEISIPAVVLLASVGPSGVFNLSWPLLRNLWCYLPQMLTKRLFQPSPAALERLILHRLPDIREDVLEQIQPDSGQAATEIILTLTSKKLKVDHLRGAKALVIAGKYDKIMPPSVQRKISQKYNCEYQEFPHGHMIMLEDNADQTLHYILKWLEKK